MFIWTLEKGNNQRYSVGWNYEGTKSPSVAQFGYELLSLSRSKFGEKIRANHSLQWKNLLGSILFL